MLQKETILSILLLISCSIATSCSSTTNEIPVEEVAQATKKNAIETNTSTQDIANKKTVLTTSYTVWKDGKIERKFSHKDTIRTIEDLEKNEVVPYEIFVTVK